jgi:hypothetical protein
VDVAVLLTLTPQILVPRTVEVLVAVQLVATTKLDVNSAEAPGARVAATTIGAVLSFVTTMLVMEIFPVFLIVPVNVSTPPGLTGAVGQFCTMDNEGFVAKGQVAEAELLTGSKLQASTPVAVTVLLTEHESAGEVNAAVKLAEAPGASEATVKTVGGVDWLSMTTTLFNVTLPGLLTVPV